MRNNTDEMYHLIIMDVEMPEMSGWETTEILIQMYSEGQLTSLCPIIAHTAYSGENDISRCREAGMTDRINKPSSLEELKQLKEKYLTF